MKPGEIRRYHKYSFWTEPVKPGKPVLKVFGPITVFPNPTDSIALYKNYVYTPLEALNPLSTGITTPVTALEGQKQDTKGSCVPPNAVGIHGCVV